MNTAEFFEQLDARIAKYDLLCHPFYQAWSAGRLTRNDLREYAQDYYHHVEAFPSYLAALGLRLEDGELRRAVLANMCDNSGSCSAGGLVAVLLGNGDGTFQQAQTFAGKFEAPPQPPFACCVRQRYFTPNRIISVTFDS